jgi:hypothetical protein
MLEGACFVYGTFESKWPDDDEDEMDALRYATLGVPTYPTSAAVIPNTSVV